MAHTTDQIFSFAVPGGPDDYAVESPKGASL